MRVAEIGLRVLAKKLGVKLTDKRVEIPIQFGTWEKVIAQIKIKIDQAHQLPKNEKREKQLQFYSDAADRCGYLKSYTAIRYLMRASTISKAEPWARWIVRAHLWNF